MKSEIKVKIEGTDVGTKIIPLYIDGKSIEEIAKVFSIKNHHKLISAINEYIKKNELQIQKDRLKAINPFEIFKLKQEGYTSVKIGTMYNISGFEVDSIFDKYCKANNINKREFMERKREEKRKIEESIDNNELIKDLKNGYSLKQLAEKYKISQAKVKQIIKQKLSPEEIRIIFIKNRTKQYISDEKAFEILKLFREGYTRSEIAEKFGCKTGMVYEVLKRQYSKMGKTKVPKIMAESVFNERVKTKKYTREKLIKEADKQNTIIPKKYLDEYFGKEVFNKENPEQLRKRDIDLKKIRDFVISKFSDLEFEEEKRKLLFKNFNIARTLKENEYDSIHQALALVYSLPQITNTAEEVIFNLLDNNEEMLQALKIIWDDTSNKEEYVEKLKQCKLAQNVKLAIMLEEMREDTLNERKLDMSKYEAYKQLANETKLKARYDLAIMENKQLFKGNDR